MGRGLVEIVVDELAVLAVRFGVAGELGVITDSVSLGSSLPVLALRGARKRPEHTELHLYAAPTPAVA